MRPEEVRKKFREKFMVGDKIRIPQVFRSKEIPIHFPPDDLDQFEIVDMLNIASPIDSIMTEPIMVIKGALKGKEIGLAIHERLLNAIELVGYFDE